MPDITPARIHLDHHERGDTEYVRGLADALFIAGAQIATPARLVLQDIIEAERALIRRRVEREESGR